ncbi:hypothetical protein [Streptomyces sp. NPDC047525]|uniref:hypothetical protein n=1 Tax=Streptomyces sp. NPDC047525 TaxID=3155264 RepID=UPI0033F3CE28
MPTSFAHEVTAALISYRRGRGDAWVTLVDVTSDLMHLASYMRTDIERCLDGDAKARLDERAPSAMPSLHPSVEPIANTDDAASADHCFDLYVHASDAAAVLRVHTADDAHTSFSAALNQLLAALGSFAAQLGFNFTDVMRSARTSYRIEQHKAR